MSERRFLRIALVDMDGTLVDYHNTLKNDLAKIASPNDPVDIEFNNEPEWLRGRINLIRNQDGWWQGLPILQAGFNIVSLLRKHQFALHILTKGPPQSPNAWTEKALWCRKNISDAMVTITEDKSLVYGKILVDDWPPYISSWIQWRPRGLVIMPDQPWNQGFEHPNVIRYTHVPSIYQTDKSLDEVESRIIKLIDTFS